MKTIRIISRALLSGALLCHPAFLEAVDKDTKPATMQTALTSAPASIASPVTPPTPIKPSVTPVPKQTAINAQPAVTQADPVDPVTIKPGTLTSNPTIQDYRKGLSIIDQEHFDKKMAKEKNHFSSKKPEDQQKKLTAFLAAQDKKYAQKTATPAIQQSIADLKALINQKNLTQEQYIQAVELKAFIEWQEEYVHEQKLLSQADGCLGAYHMDDTGACIELSDSTI